MESKDSILISQIILPEYNWGLSLPKETRFTISRLDLFGNELDKMGVHYQAENDLIRLSIVMEEQDEQGTPEKAREQFFTVSYAKIKNASPFPITTANFRMLSDYAIGEYEIEDPDLRQKHWNAYLVKESVWIDIHISKMSYAPEDEKIFEEILTSIKIEETSIDSIIASGEWFRNEEEYEEAIGYFGHILRKQDIDRMSNEQKLHMTLGLIVSYFPINIERALGAVEFGITKVDSTCPDFYYLKAMMFCCLKRPDKKNAVGNLEKTLELWDNRIGNDQFFDIQTIPAFQRIAKNKAFRDLLKRWPIQKT